MSVFCLQPAVNRGLNMVVFLRFLLLQKVFPLGIKGLRICTTAATLKLTKERERKEKHACAYNKLRLETERGAQASQK